MFDSVAAQGTERALRTERSAVRSERKEPVTMPRVAVVTGGASGIGHALAVALAERGDVVTVADIDEQAAETVAKDLRARHPGRAEGAALDVRDATAVAGLIQSVKDKRGRIDLVFNNAGVSIGGTAEEHTLDHWNRAIDVNLRGVVHGVLAAYPIMLEQGSGHIINTASLAGLVPSPGKIAYTATKHAVVGLSLGLRSEAASHGVGVSVVCPGYVDTPLLDNVNSGLPQTVDGPHARERAVKQQGKLYLPDQLARDVLRGIDRNQAVIVGPAYARVAWWIARFTPSFSLLCAAKNFREMRSVPETGHVAGTA
jgi:NADP-dependent 3-hydroxy acid dehydrogenase YdfG